MLRLRAAGCRASDELRAITKRLGIKSIFELFSYSAQNSLCPPEHREKVVPWFEPADGIAWLEAIIGFIRADGSAVKNPEELLQDLASCQNILRQAQTAGAKWHFEMDI